MAQAVSQRPLTAEVQLRTQVGCLVKKVSLGQVFAPEDFGFPHSTSIYKYSTFIVLTLLQAEGRAGCALKPSNTVMLFPIFSAWKGNYVRSVCQFRHCVVILKDVKCFLLLCYVSTIFHNTDNGKVIVQPTKQKIPYFRNSSENVTAVVLNYTSAVIGWVNSLKLPYWTWFVHSLSHTVKGIHVVSHKLNWE